MSPVFVGSVLVVVSALLAATFMVGYHVFSQGAWRHDSMGRHVMAFVGADFAVFALAAARLLFGAGLDSGWFVWLRVIVFLAIPWTIGWRIWILWKLRKERA